MTIFFTVVISLIVIVFLMHMLYSIDTKTAEEMREKRIQAEDNFKGADPRKVYGKGWDKNIPRPRICPVCGTALQKHEFLYASFSDHLLPGEKRQAHIYGCRYCYLGQAESSEKENISETLDI